MNQHARLPVSVVVVTLLACGSSTEALNFGSKIENAKDEKRNAAQAAEVACPPNKLGQR